VTGPGRTRPAVDVVISNHDYGRFLRAAIDSALDQTVEPRRVIVVDDGSTDDSDDVIASYAGRVEAVFKACGGQASALNAGLERVGGEIVLFLDADDVLCPAAVERVADAFRAEPGLAKVQFRMEVASADGTPTGMLKPPAHVALLAGDLRPRVLRFPFDVPWVGGGTAYRTETLRRIAPIPEGEPAGADWYLVHVSALLGPVGAVDEPLALYRWHGRNTHEPEGPPLDLEWLRASIRYTARARTYLEAAAARLQLAWDPRDASMSEIADRAISLKLGRAAHPVAGDTLPGLLRRGVRAARRRFDVSGSLKLAFVLWLAALVLAPRRLSWPLAEAFVFPERRQRVNGILRRLHLRPRG
jgi:hypothetical protein